MSQSGLIVRRSIRHELVLPAKVRIAPEHAETVRFVKGVADANGWINCDLIDFASGGAGVVTTVLLPRGASIELLLPSEDPTQPPHLQLRTRVMRVLMTDRRPAYMVGLAFTDLDEHAVEAIEALLDRLEGKSGGSEPTC